MEKFNPRLTMETIVKFNNGKSPAIYELDFEYFKNQTSIRKEFGTELYPLNHYEVSNKANNIEIDASLVANTEDEALREIFEELRDSVAHYEKLSSQEK